MFKYITHCLTMCTLNLLSQLCPSLMVLLMHCGSAYLSHSSSPLLKLLFVVMAKNSSAAFS